MSVFTQTLDGEDWHLTYDTEAKELSIRNTSGNTRLSPDEFLASTAAHVLEVCSNCLS